MVAATLVEAGTEVVEGGPDAEVVAGGATVAAEVLVPGAVVVADAEASEAEKAEQRPSPTDAACSSCDSTVQAAIRQGATSTWIEE